MANKNMTFPAPFGDFRPWRFCVYVFVLAICFLLFNQGDLNHTAASSYAYLTGHFSDFYEYNKIAQGGNDYLPLLYVIFAIWNIPVYFIVLTIPPELQASVLVPILLAWSKLLLVVFFFGVVKLLAKISEILVEHGAAAKPPVAAVFATAPIAIFAVFIFGQYDIIAVFFALLGFYFYLKKDWVRFAWFFSIAISFKYFAIVIYLPLLLMVEKRSVHIIKLLLIGVLVTLLQLAIYWHSEVFRGEIFSLASDRAMSVYGSGLSLFNPKLYVITAYLLVCAYLYWKKFDVDFEWKRTAVLVPIVAYGLMFSAVFWHPQWIIIVMPFFALAYIYVRNAKIFAWLDLLGMLAFVWICVNFFPNNVDVGMINRGILKEFVPLPPLRISDLMSPDWLIFFNRAFYFYLFSPILIIVAETIFNKYQQRSEIGSGMNSVRFSLGLSFFLIPALVCTYIPYSLVSMIKPDAFVKVYSSIFVLKRAVVSVGQIVDARTVVQTFKPKLNGLSGISVRLATYARKNTGELTMRLEDTEGRKLAQQSVDLTLVLDNAIHNFSFQPIVDSEGKTYSLVLQANKSYPGNAITAWASRTDVYPDGELSVGGVPTGGDLVMEMQFAPQSK